MANNYLEFSECIEGLSDAEIAFFTAALTWEPPYDEDWELPSDVAWPAWWEVGEDSVSFDYSIHEARREIIFYAEEYGNVNAVAELVQEFILKFRPDYVFQITYGETCSRPRPGEFGGGAYVVSKYGIERVNAHSWASDTVHAIRRRLEGEKG